jgi:cyanophycinase
VKSDRRLSKTLLGIAVVGLATFGVLGLYLVHMQQQAVAASDDVDPPGGTLILCGGGSVPDEIFARFVRQAGGPAAHIVVLPAYHPTAKEERELIAEWKRYGARTVVVLKAKTREEADAAAEKLTSATGVWISGGSQRHLAEIYVDTEVERQIQELLDRDGVVGGVSAGAAIMTQTMIIGGSEPGFDHRGFDLLPGVVVDQHFLTRNRARRLLAVLSRHPDLIGLGIDEHTAVVVQRAERRWSVIGKSYAMICLPSSDGFPRLEVLKAGDAAYIDELLETQDDLALNSTNSTSL